MTKKIVKIIFITILLFFSFFRVSHLVEAKTLRDLKLDYEKTKSEYEANKYQQQLTNEEIAKITENIASVQSKIETGQKEVIRLNDENVELDNKISEKKEEIKKIMNYYQLSNGESAYLEYIFKANDYTDFIYRMAISEQLSNYNDRLITEYNEMIEENKKNVEEIKKRNIELQNQQKTLNTELAKLNSQMSRLYDDAVDFSEALKRQEEIISIYENDFNCKLDDDLASCIGNDLPPDTSFWRPTNIGYISSNYGIRYEYWNNPPVYRLHDGIDIGMDEGTPVYAMASGKVVARWDKYRCGGNMMWIQHKINGQYYTTSYLHLQSFAVNIGDVVTKDTIIGYSGGGPSTYAWEQCSTGGHLHIGAMYGRASIDYVLYGNAYYSNLIDPRQIVNLPSLGGSYYNRTSRY